MTGSKEMVSFVSLRPSIEVEGKQNSLFCVGQSLSVLLYLSTQN